MRGVFFYVFVFLVHHLACREASILRTLALILEFVWTFASMRHMLPPRYRYLLPM